MIVTPLAFAHAWTFLFFLLQFRYYPIRIDVAKHTVPLAFQERDHISFRVRRCVDQRTGIPDISTLQPTRFPVIIYGLFHYRRRQCRIPNVLFGVALGSCLFAVTPSVCGSCLHSSSMSISMSSRRGWLTPVSA